MDNKSYPGNISGQIIFHFCIDIAWEIRIDKLCSSDFFSKLGWLEEDTTEKITSRRVVQRVALNIDSNCLLPFQNISLTKYKQQEKVTVVLDDSGALGIEFVLDFNELALSTIAKDSEYFFDNSEILLNVRRIALSIQDKIKKFAVKPRVDIAHTQDFEDYIIYRFLSGFDINRIDDHKVELASLIDGKRESLSSGTSEANNDHADEVLEYRFNHPRAGLTIANWSGAICFGGTWDGVIDIILLANMELLELRLISEHLTNQNDEFDRLCSRWYYNSIRPSTWFGGNLLSRMLKTKKEIKDQLGRIKNPLLRFGKPGLAKIYNQLKEIFLINYYMDEIKEELEELIVSESTIAERANARRQDILALLGVLVAFEYVTSGISDIIKFVGSMLF